MSKSLDEIVKTNYSAAELRAMAAELEGKPKPIPMTEEEVAIEAMKQEIIRRGILYPPA